jgi:hypothetical protein
MRKKRLVLLFFLAWLAYVLQPLKAEETTAEQTATCIKVKRIRNLSVVHQKYQETRDGETFSVYRIEICEQPPLFWEIEIEEPSRFSNPCTGMK